MECMVAQTQNLENMEDKILKAFQSLMGMNGDKFVEEIFNNQCLSSSSYQTICDNISYNGKDSIIEHFGLVHYYYLQGVKKEKAEANLFAIANS